MSKFKVTFTLDEEDANYFRTLYRKAKKGAKTADAEQIIKDAREIVAEVKKSKKTPKFVIEAISVLSDLTDLVVDEDYAAPQKVKEEVLAGVAYFSNPEDLIPDHIPGLGFLDDAIMVKFIEEEFRHELWGYRKFQKARDTSEQRPWADPGKDRLKKRLENDRKKIRAQIAAREAKEDEKKQSGSYRGW
jgi:uncharacterized membrane protein YkvA (DUF1232 family)